ncbi:hypothetical protein [Mesorhizobium sp. B2-3-5]|uniref:hypothetical protein n=1 Tax=Mesorhizobium sp. B2-3-5 TaxID=2589958 RepID=UPI0011292E31|nr:hypothetical protein [Mesorhizobium sp. B2-3-5]TPM16331.1 hypothetical protein FJ958_29235 [Mesorhizobium sp. B2-3-5]
MTTDTVDFTRDIYSENLVLNIRPPHDGIRPSIAGISIYSRGSEPYESSRERFISIVLDLCYAYQDYAIWLLVGTEAWQRDSRILRHQKLTGLLRKNKVDLSQFGKVEEVQISSEYGLKFFVAVNLTKENIGDAFNIVLEEKCSYVVVGREMTNIMDFLKAGWIGKLYLDSKLVLVSAENDSVILKAFDDKSNSERGVTAIGNPLLIQSLFDRFQ